MLTGPSSSQCGPQTPTLSPLSLVFSWPSTVPGALNFACSELKCSWRPDQSSRAALWGVLCTVRWGTLPRAYILKENWSFLSQKLTISDSSWQGAFCAQVCSPCSDLVWDYRFCACYHTCWEFRNAAAFLWPQDTILLCSSATWDSYYFSIFLVIPEPLDERV